MATDAVHDLSIALSTCANACDSATLLLDVCNAFVDGQSSVSGLVLKRRQTIVDSVKIKGAHSKLQQFQHALFLEQTSTLAIPYNKALLAARRASEDRERAESEIAAMLAPSLIPRVRILKITLMEYHQGILLRYVPLDAAGRLPALVWISTLLFEEYEVFEHLVPLLRLEFKMRLSHRIECEILEAVKTDMAKERDIWVERNNAITLFIHKDFGQIMGTIDRERSLGLWQALKNSLDIDRGYIMAEQSREDERDLRHSDGEHDEEYGNSDQEYDETANFDFEREDIDSDDRAVSEKPHEESRGPVYGSQQSAQEALDANTPLVASMDENGGAESIESKDHGVKDGTCPVSDPDINMAAEE